MQLRELTLHNVGVYKGRQSINLSTSPDRPVLLIGGLNGHGKTTLLDSLQLVLYGNRARCSARRSMAYEDYLRHTINRSVPPTDGASIRLVFDISVDGEKTQYEVTRTWRMSGKRIKEAVDVVVNGRPEPATAESWSEHIEEILPLDVASLFLFDGEMIAELADPDRASVVIESAVRTLLGVALLDQLRVDLLALQRRQPVGEDDVRLDQHMTDLEAELGRIQGDLEIVGQRRGGVRVAIGTAGIALEQAEREFERLGGRLYERRTQLEAATRSLKQEIQRLRDQLRALAEGPLPVSLVRTQLAEVVSQAEAENSAALAGELDTLLRQRDDWIVGCLPERSRPAIASLLRDDREKRNVESAAEPYLGLSRGGVADAHSILRLLPVLVGQAREHSAAIRSLLDQLAHIDRQLAAVPDDDAISSAINRRDNARLELARLHGSESTLEDDVDRLTRERDQVKAQLGKAAAQRDRAVLDRADVRRVVEHSERVRETLKTLSDQLLVRHIGRIEVATLESLQALLRKTDLICDLRIDPRSFELTLLDQEGSTVDPTRLSAGERQLVAVSLLWALSRVTGRQVPTIIDTPLGRLDSSHRERLVEKYFPGASAQVLLLSTDEEIDEDLYKRLVPAVSRSFILQHDPDEHTTSIVPGYWWPQAVSDVA